MVKEKIVFILDIILTVRSNTDSKASSKLCMEERMIERRDSGDWLTRENDD